MMEVKTSLKSVKEAVESVSKLTVRSSKVSECVSEQV